MKTEAIGLVLPPGSVAPTHTLTGGDITVTIDAVDPENGYEDEGKTKPISSEHVMARCIYPSGEVKSHQVKTVEDLLPKVVNQLRGKYGAGEVKFKDVPKALEAGQVIVLEV